MNLAKRLTTAVASVLSVAALASVSATQAHAALDPTNSIGIDFDADTTTIISKTQQPVNFPRTTLAARTDTQILEGTLKLPQAAANLNLGPLPLTLANFKISIINPSQVTGTTTPGTSADGRQTLELKASQTFQIRIDSVQPLNIDSGSVDLNLVPSNGSCVTPPTTATLAGSIDAAKLLAEVPAADAHIRGTYTIPPFANCGLFTGVLNAIISGPNNTLDVHVTNPRYSTDAATALRARLAR
ncbi:MAG: hypothetical protein NTW76_17245 [Corynebacteriales bacterium]|uniref:Dehydratase n=1 Tax=Williamsia herbipolensis TaxID=1603258 RepID=A0AAU4K5P3_9NOCA|nr:hypothetical protein [Williamsia herbipolensis]MCX6471034.1 hypothetical protein [Mycobacteriales bacterium]